MGAQGGRNFESAETEVLKLRNSQDNTVAIRKAAKAMRSGAVVVFPTETVYGIGTNALDAGACAKVYRIKGRERNKALIVLVSDMAMLDKVACLPKKYRKPLEKAWPAPLTVIARTRTGIPRVITAQDKTVAVRIPDNTTLLALISAAKVPIVAPSANPSGLEPAKTGTQARRYFYGKVDMILDSGNAGSGVPSTILRLRDMRVLRHGAFSDKQIKKTFGKIPK